MHRHLIRVCVSTNWLFLGPRPYLQIGLSQSQLHFHQVNSIVAVRLLEDHGHLWFRVRFVLLPSSYAAEEVVHRKFYSLTTGEGRGIRQGRLALDSGLIGMGRVCGVVGGGGGKGKEGRGEI